MNISIKGFLSLLGFGKRKVSSKCKINLNVVGNGLGVYNNLEVYVGYVLVGVIKLDAFMDEFRCGRGYEFIDNCIVLWVDEGKVCLSSLDIIDLTVRLRKFGHRYEFEY